MTWDQSEIDLARRLIACGLSRFTLTEEDSGLYGFDHNGWTVELEVGDTTDYKRIEYGCVVTDTGPELLPVLDDFALLGWLICELEQVTGCAVGTTIYFGDWMIAVGSVSYSAPTRIEALTAALEAAKAPE